MTRKRFFKSGGALFAAALFALIGCSSPGGDGTETPALMSIKAETTKTDYVRGQALKLETITITGTYSDGATEKIPLADAAITGYDPAAAGIQTVTITARGKTATFTVTVTDDPGKAKDALSAAVETALDAIESIVVSANGNDVPQGVAWLTLAQKQALDKALEAALELAASGDASLEAIAEALEELEQAAAEVAALAEAQTGTATGWSYTVTFNNNGGDGGPETKTVAAPATTVGSLPAAPLRSGYEFAGWNTRADGSGSAFIATTLVAADITVYARWTAIVNAQTPLISVQPRSAAYTVGDEAAALTVTAASRDGGELSYLWHTGSSGEGTAIEGATEASYTPPTTAAGAVSYYVRVTNTRKDVNGTKTAVTDSNEADITVTTVDALTPVISVQPRSAAYDAGTKAAALAVTAASRDGGELSYQWHSRVDGGSQWTAIDGATESSYTPPTTAAGVVSYYVKVTNTNDALSGTKTASTDSNEATITVTTVDARAPLISAQPQKAAAYSVGAAAAALSVTAASQDGGELSYQWHNGSAETGWTVIERATESSYTPLTTVAGVLSYYVKITNTNNALSGTKTASIDSETATITVTVVNARPPVISAQPQGASYAINGEAAPLAVTAESPDGGTLSYQWYRAGDNGGTVISGATTASYTPPTAEYGTISYYVRITNTNNALSGTKTASIDSATAAVTVAAANARAPSISLQPQDAAYLPSSTANPLTVTAESPDGGTLSYQWYSSVGTATEGTAINGATTASYTPPTGTEGTFYYYVAVTNTNNGAEIDGLTTAVTKSRVATIKVTSTGTYNFVFVWANDEGELLSDAPDSFVISRSLGESLAITAADDLTDRQWSINGTDIDAPRGTAQSIIIKAANYPIGKYSLSLYAKKGGVSHSINITFTVSN